MSLIGLVEAAWYLVYRRADVAGEIRGRLPADRDDLRILDLGGGTGRIPLALSSRVRGSWVVADIDPESLARVDPRFGTVLLRPDALISVRMLRAL